jgi:hypothetical protein
LALYRLRDRQVTGVVRRKATGLTREFDPLVESFGQNIAAMEQARGVTGLGGSDPVDALVATQNHMKQKSLELKRSSDVGIGYAYHIRRIRECLQNLNGV